MRTFPIAFALVLLALPLQAQEADDYRVMVLAQRFNDSDFSVLPEAQALADAGVPRAMFIIAVAHLYGRGMDKDEAAGIDWMSRAAEAGFPRAMVMLGQAAQWGWYGEPRDPVKARLWLEHAAALDTPEAYGALGQLWQCGDCGAVDPARAEMLYRRGTVLGDAMSMVGLGRMLTAPTQLEEARALFRRAALAGNTEGARRWAEMARDGRGGEEALDEAREGFVIAAAAGNAAAALDLAYLLREHPDLAQSTTEALVWCLRGQATATEALLTELTTLCDSLSAGLSPADRKAAMAEAAVTP